MAGCEVGLHVKMKFPPACWTVGGDGLTGEQIVAEKNRPAVGHRGSVPHEPALRGIAFAVLLLRAVLGRDEFRWQRQNLGGPGPPPSPTAWNDSRAID